MCGGCSALQLVKLPRQLFVNLTASAPEKVAVLHPVVPREIEDLLGSRYRLKGANQYCPSKKHFGALRNLYSEGAFRWFLIDSSATDLRGGLPDELRGRDS